MAKVTSPLIDQQFSEVEDERRVKDVAAARSLYSKYLYQNTLRSQTFVATRNQLEGGRPYNPAELVKQGLGWQTNVNFGDAQAARDRTLLPYWRAVNSSPRLISVTIDETSPHTGKWQAIIEEEYGRWNKRWEQDYYVQYMRMAKDFVDFGPGMVMWEDKDNPRFKAVNVQRVYFPLDCQMSQDEWPCVAFVKGTDATELYSKIRTKKDRKASEYVGWNPDAVKSAIIYSKNGQAWDGRDFTKYQDMLVNNDIVISSEMQPLDVVWLYVKQFDGKITCCAFCVQSTGSDDDFLYYKEDYAEDFKSIVAPVWYDTGSSGMVHSIKGFGIKNYYYSIMQNRLKSRMIDGASMAMSLNFVRTSEAPDESPPIEQYGGVNLFPQGLTQLTTYPQYSQGLQVVEMLEQNSASNNSIYRQQQTQVQASDTATQAKILAAQQGEVMEASMAIYLSQVGQNIFGQCLERLRRRGNPHPDAKRFRERCIERGVPAKVLHDSFMVVTTGASAGLANPAIRAMKLQAGLALSNTPGVNRQWFLENFVANEFGADAAQPGNALLAEGADSEPSQRRQAMMENGDFGQGMPLPVAPSDAHAEHIDEHLKPMDQIVMQYRQSGGQIDKAKVPSMVISDQHMGEHFSYLSNDTTKKDAYKALWPRYTAFQSILRGILTRLRNEQIQAQNEQAQSQIGMQQQMAEQMSPPPPPFMGPMPGQEAAAPAGAAMM
jgi:hypothetical protein